MYTGAFIDNVTIVFDVAPFVRGFTDVVTPRPDDRGNVTRYGKVYGLRFYEGPRGLSITGSLAKAINGHNFFGPSPAELLQFLLWLQRFIDADLFQARVYTLEYGPTLVMDHPVGSYLPLLGELSRFTRVEWASGRQSVLYLTEDRSLEFYDKIRQSRKEK